MKNSLQTASASGYCSGCSGESACVGRVPVFKTLNPAQMEKLHKIISRKVFKDKEIIFHEGEPLKQLMVVRSGKVKLVKYNENGEEILTDILGHGDFYGGDTMFSDAKKTETGIAMGSCGICYINTSDLKELIYKEPDIGVKLLTYYCEIANSQRVTKEILAIKNAKTRVSQFLLEMSRRHETSDLDLSQEDIANSISLTQETVSRKISQLKKEGLIKTSGHKKITILDKEALKFCE